MNTTALTTVVLEGFSPAQPPVKAVTAAPDHGPQPGSTRCLARPSTDMHGDLFQLQEMERHLTDTLHRARNFGTEYGSPADWTTTWHRQWCHVEDALARIRGLLNQVHHHLASHTPDHWALALNEWDHLQPENTRLIDALMTLRGQAQMVNETISDDWRQFSLTLESQISTISTAALAFRQRLDLLAHPAPHTATEAPAPPPTDAERKQHDLDQAAIEIQEEQHQNLGLKDVVKAMFLWVESPEDRVRKNKLKA